jgi:ABC-2 type transport system ATP-binding protein
VRENVYLRGAMLGYTRAFIDNMYESIIDFSEINEFQDRPFRTLSSGMKSRIAFSVACLVRPDILILDEVLSVGDGAFQKKSEIKMREILDSDITGLFVSHSTAQVRRICTKALWLSQGRQIGFGDCGELCDRYEEYLNNKAVPQPINQEVPYEV